MTLRPRLCALDTARRNEGRRTHQISNDAGQKAIYNKVNGYNDGGPAFLPRRARCVVNSKYIYIEVKIAVKSGEDFATAAMISMTIT